VEEPDTYLWSSLEGVVEEDRATQTKTEARRNAGIFPKIVPSLGLCSPPPIPSSKEVAKKGNLIKFGYEMLKPNI